MAYVDASAFAKLTLGEAGYERLRDELVRRAHVVSSALLGVEVLRAVARYGAAYREKAEADLGVVSLLPIDGPVLRRAATLRPPVLRSLDAIHLASALSLDDDLGALISYDERLLAAARALGLPVASP